MTAVLYEARHTWAVHHMTSVDWLWKRSYGHVPARNLTGSSLLQHWALTADCSMNEITRHTSGLLITLNARNVCHQEEFCRKESYATKHTETIFIFREEYYSHCIKITFSLDEGIHCVTLPSYFSQWYNRKICNQITVKWLSPLHQKGGIYIRPWSVNCKML